MNKKKIMKNLKSYEFNCLDDDDRKHDMTISTRLLEQFSTEEIMDMQNNFKQNMSNNEN